MSNDNVVKTSNLNDEPKEPEALSAGRFAERLWGYKDQVGSHSEMGRLYERDRADFWYARFMEATAHETCDALTEAHCYEGEKDYQLDQLLDYLHYDPDTRSHPDWVARAQAAEAELNKARRCVGCGGTLVLPDRCDDCSSLKANSGDSFPEKE